MFHPNVTIQLLKENCKDWWSLIKLYFIDIQKIWSWKESTMTILEHWRIINGVRIYDRSASIREISINVSSVPF